MTKRCKLTKVELTKDRVDHKPDRTTFFAVAVVDHVCVELALLFLHRSFDNNFEVIIKSFLHLFAVQSLLWGHGNFVS